MSISSRRFVAGQWCDQLATSKDFAAIIAGMSAPESFKQETSFCDGNKICPGRISSPQGGEALFWVVSVSRPGVVRLETEDGKPVQNSWNIEHLRK